MVKPEMSHSTLVSTAFRLDPCDPGRRRKPKFDRKAGMVGWSGRRGSGKGLGVRAYFFSNRSRGISKPPTSSPTLRACGAIEALMEHTISPLGIFSIRVAWGTDIVTLKFGEM